MLGFISESKTTKRIVLSSPMAAIIACAQLAGRHACAHDIRGTFAILSGPHLLAFSAMASEQHGGRVGASLPSKVTRRPPGQRLPLQGRLRCSERLNCSLCWRLSGVFPSIWATTHLDDPITKSH